MGTCSKTNFINWNNLRFLGTKQNTGPSPETTPSLECYPKLSWCCADKKQAKNKNLYIFFSVVMSNPPPPLCHFLSLIFGSPLSLTWWRHFWMAPFDLLNWITAVSSSMCKWGVQLKTAKRIIWNYMILELLGTKKDILQNHIKPNKFLMS